MKPTSQVLLAPVLALLFLCTAGFPGECRAAGEGAAASALESLARLPRGGIRTLAPGTHRVDRDVVIEGDVVFQPGAVLFVEEGRQVEFRGRIEAGPRMIFSGPGMTPVERAPGEWVSGVLCNQEVSVLWFGARGDGDTRDSDDTDAIRAAMYSLVGQADEGRRGGTIRFPRGVYRHRELDFGGPMYGHLVYWEGDGSGTSDWKGGVRSSATTLRYTGGGTALTARKLSLRKLTLSTGTGRVGIATRAFNSDCAIEDVSVTGFSEAGLDMTGTVSFIVKIDKCRFTANGVGIKLLGNAVTVSNCDISANTLGGILLAGGVVQNIVHNTIETNGGYGIRFEGLPGNGGVSSAVTVRGNYFEKNRGDGDVELLEANAVDSVVVEGNYFAGSDQVRYGVYSRRSRGGRFVGNRFNGAHAEGAAAFVGYGRERNVGNLWSHGAVSEGRFGPLHGVRVDGWEKLTVEKTAEGAWTVNGAFLAEAEDTAPGYQNLWVLGTVDDQIPAGGVVAALRLRTRAAFSGVSAAVARLGTSGSPRLFLAEGYDLAAPPSPDNVLQVVTGDRALPGAGPEFLTLQVAVGEGESVASIRPGAALDIWVRIEEPPP